LRRISSLTETRSLEFDDTLSSPRVRGWDIRGGLRLRL
jgi:hypothetical protein